ncbi:MAG: phosphoribosyltransferase family protein [Saprospiraceae bacterium]
MKTIPFLTDFLHLFFPNVCIACHENHPLENQYLCVGCNFRLPRTDFHFHKENPFTERFWGRFPLVYGASMLYFKKRGLTRILISNLKYKGQKEIGNRLGETYGRTLKASPYFNDMDAIIPVPLHFKKEQKRGYNQSAAFGDGLSVGLEIPQWLDVLKRKRHSETQTRKGTIERLQNVETIFEIIKPEKIEGKHLLLVDDVLTTGATLESCALELLKVEGVKISIVTIAIAVK